MGHKGPVERSRCIGAEAARTQMLIKPPAAKRHFPEIAFWYFQCRTTEVTSPAIRQVSTQNTPDLLLCNTHPYLQDSDQVDCVWNVMTHAQKPHFVFRRNWRVHLNPQGTSAQSTTSSRGVRISGSNVGYTMFRGSVKSTGYPLHSPFSPSLPLPCVTVSHHISGGLYIE